MKSSIIKAVAYSFWNLRLCFYSSWCQTKAVKVVWMGFEIISLFEGYFLMTVCAIGNQDLWSIEDWSQSCNRNKTKITFTTCTSLPTSMTMTFVRVSTISINALGLTITCKHKKFGHLLSDWFIKFSSHFLWSKLRWLTG